MHGTVTCTGSAILRFVRGAGVQGPRRRGDRGPDPEPDRSAERDRSPGDGQLAKWKRLFNAVAAKQNAQQDGRPLIRLVSEVMAPVRFGSTAEFDAARARVNERLLLSGFEVLETGKVRRARQAATLGEAQTPRR